MGSKKSKYFNLFSSAVIALSVVATPVTGAFAEEVELPAQQTNSYTAEQVTNLINALNPSSVLTYVADVNLASTTYENMAEEEKTKVTATIVTKLNSHIAAAAVVNQISTVTTVALIEATTTADELAEINEDVVAAREAYVGLTTAQRTYVKNLTTLTTLETAIKNREAYFANVGLLTEWNEAFSKVAELAPKVPVGTTIEQYMTEGFDKYTGEQMSDIAEARAQYTALTTTTRKYVPAADLAKLVDHENAVKRQTPLETQVATAKATIFTTNLNAIVLTETDTFPTKVEEIKTELDRIEADEPAVFKAISSTTKVRVVNYVAAAELVSTINGLTTVEAIEALTTKEDVEVVQDDLEQVRLAYLALTSAQRTFVKNYPLYSTLLTATNKQLLVIENAEALEGWTTSVSALAADALDLTALTKENYGKDDGIQVYTPEEIAAIEEARKQYNLLSYTLKKYVLASDLNKLVAHETAYDTYQKDLKLEIESDQKAEQETQQKLEQEISDWTAEVAALGDVKTFSEDLDEYALETNKYESKEAIDTALENYATLSLEAKEDDAVKMALVTLNNHEAAYNKQVLLDAQLAEKLEQELADKLNDVITLISAIDTAKATSNVEQYETAVTEAKTAFEDELSDEERAQISTATKTKYYDHKAALAVVSAIKNAETAETEIEAAKTLDDLEGATTPVVAARNAFKELTYNQTLNVFNLEDLENLETAISDKKTEINKAAAIKEFIDKVEELPEEEYKFTDDTYLTITTTTTTKYTTGTDADKQEAIMVSAREIYDELAATYKTEQDVIDAETLLGKHEAALLIQKDLEGQAAAYASVKDDVDAFETAVGKLTFDLLDFDGVTTIITQEDIAEMELGEDETPPTPTKLYKDTQPGLILAADEALKKLASESYKYITPPATEGDKTLVQKAEEYVASLAAQIQLIEDVQTAKVNAVISAIEGFTATANVEATENAKTLFDALDDAGKAEVGTDRQTKLNNYVKAAAVVKLMEDLTVERINASVLVTPEAIEGEEAQEVDLISELEAEIATIKTKYTELNTVAQKPLVGNYSTLLTSIESKVAAKKAALQVEAALNDWADAYEKIKELDADAAYDVENKTPPYNVDTEVGLINVADTAYGNIDEEYLQYVVNDELGHLRALQQNIADYEQAVQDAADLAEAIEAALTPWKTTYASIQNIADKEYTAENFVTKGAYTDVEKAAIIAAQNAYDDLATAVVQETTQNLQSKVDSIHSAHVTALTKSVEDYDRFVGAAATTAIKVVTDAIDAITSTDAAEYVTQVGAAKTAYTNLGTANPEYLNVFKTSEIYATAKTTYTNHVAAAQVVSTITALGTVQAVNDMTLQSALNTVKTKLVAAKKAYAENLTDTQKGLVVNAALLDDLQSAIEAKQEAFDKVAAIKAFMDKYDALPITVVLEFTGKTFAELPSLTKYTAAEKTAIKEAYAIYDGYDSTKKGYVDVELTDKTSIVDLYEAVIAQEILEKDAADDKALKDAEAALALELKPWNDAIAPLVSLFGLAKFPLTLTAEQFEAETKYASDLQGKLDAARTAYAGLISEEAKAAAAENEVKLAALETDFANQATLQAKFDAEKALEVEANKLQATIDAITTLNPTEVATYPQAVTDASGLYDALTPDSKAKVTTAQKTALTNHKAASAIVSKITTASDATRISQANAAGLTTILSELSTAEFEYKMLTTVQQGFVKNYANIASTKTAVAKQQVILDNATAIEAWRTAYGKLPGLISLQGITYENVDGVTWYTTAELNLITNASTKYNSVKAYIADVDSDKVIELQKYLDLVTLYNNLQTQKAGKAAAAAQLVAWNSVYDKIKGLTEHVLTDLIVETYPTTTKFAASELVDILAAELVFKNIPDSAKGYIPETDVTKYGNLLANAKIQKNVEDQIALNSAATDAQDVIDAITALSTTASDYVAKTKEAKLAFNNLSPAAKAKVSATLQTKLTNYFAAVGVVEEIEKLASTATIAVATVEQLVTYKEANATVRGKYAALTTAQRTFVTNYAILTAAESAVTARTTALANATALGAWDAAIVKITKQVNLTGKTATQFAALTAAEYYSAQELKEITEARAEYNKLSSTVKNAVAATDLQKLTIAEAQVKLQTTLEKQVATVRATAFVNDYLNAVKVNTVDFVTQVQAMQTVYEELKPDVLAAISNTNKTKVTNYIAASKVVIELNELALMDGTEANYKDKVVAARAAYTALTSAQRTFVGSINIVKLTDAENLVKTLGL